MYLLGFDIGTTSVKASLVDERTSRCVATVRYPKEENQVLAKKAGWAEQDPEMWWNSVKQATADVMRPFGVAAADISAIGISYQMHGLVLLDKNGKTLRPAIIWSDSRAVPYGKRLSKNWARNFVSNISWDLQEILRQVNWHGLGKMSQKYLNAFINSFYQAITWPIE